MIPVILMCSDPGDQSSLRSSPNHKLTGMSDIMKMHYSLQGRLIWFPCGSLNCKLRQLCLVEFGVKFNTANFTYFPTGLCSEPEMLSAIINMIKIILPATHNWHTSVGQGRMSWILCLWDMNYWKLSIIGEQNNETWFWKDKKRWEKN